MGSFCIERLHTTQTSAEFTWATMAYTDGAVPGNFAMLVLKVHIVAPEIVLHHRHFQGKNSFALVMCCYHWFWAHHFQRKRPEYWHQKCRWVLALPAFERVG